jgi:hypothetical protein
MSGLLRPEDLLKTACPDLESQGEAGELCCLHTPSGVATVWTPHSVAQL